MTMLLLMLTWIPFIQIGGETHANQRARAARAAGMSF